MEFRTKRLVLFKVIGIDIMEKGSWRSLYRRRLGFEHPTKSSGPSTTVPEHERWGFFLLGRFKFSIRIWARAAVLKPKFGNDRKKNSE